MKFFALIALPALLICANAQQPSTIPPPPVGTITTQDAMTNSDVIDLTGLSLSDDVIIQKVSSSKMVSFDTSISGLKQLKAAKVSDPVIKAMLAQESAQESAIAKNAPAPEPPMFHSTDGKTRIYVTDHPINEVTAIIRGSSESSAHVHADANGASGHAQSSSAVGGVSHAEAGDDPRTVEIQSDLQKNCPPFVQVSNNPARADVILVFRREGGKRSSFFAFGGLTGLALSAAAKVDGASLFQPNGDMIMATRENTVEKAIRAVCVSIPPPTP